MKKTFCFDKHIRKNAFILSESASNCDMSDSNRKFGFTLAEVLITLGIIGVVAAITLPTLVQNYQKRVIETRLQKFYSNINQAVQLAEVQYGDKKIWYEDLGGASFDKDGNPIEGSSEAEKWFNKYFAPHLKIVKQETLSDGTFIVYFPDGSALRLRAYANTTRDWQFYPSNAQKCMDRYGDDNGKGSGICYFLFMFVPKAMPGMAHLYNKGIEPYKYNWNGSKEQLEQGCKSTFNGGSVHRGSYCTALIQYNGWKIPEDYPFKVSY